MGGRPLALATTRENRGVTTSVDRACRLIGWPLGASIVLFFVLTLALSFGLPRRVPLHWDAAGRADSFGTPLQFTSTFAIVGVILLALVVGILLLLRRGPLTLFNVPHPEYWKAPEHEGRLRVLMAADLNHLFAGVFLFLSVTVIGSAASALSPAATLSWIVPAGGGALVVYMIGYLVFMFVHRYRPAE
jgi:hypothetical protein